MGGVLINIESPFRTACMLEEVDLFSHHSKFCSITKFVLEVSVYNIVVDNWKEKAICLFFFIQGDQGLIH